MTPTASTAHASLHFALPDGIRMILHVDMDAFYASVEERDDPSLRGKPVIVGGSPARRGVVCAANYVARQYGVRSAMPAATAVRLCPQAIFLPVRMPHYAAVSVEIREIFLRYTPDIEPLSLDEAFLDVRGSRALFGTPEQIGRRIQEDIQRELGLVASLGVAPNKFLAKIASDLEKPRGFVVVDASGVQAFLDPLPVERLWGVGQVAAASFRKLGVHTIADLRKLPVEALRPYFGNQADHLLKLAHGQDDRVVVSDREAKSISHETTFAQNVGDMDILRAWLLDLTEQVAWRLRRRHLRTKTVRLKLRFGDFSTITRSRTLSEASSSTDVLWQAADRLLESALARFRPVRLIGVGAGSLEAEGPVQTRLFDDSHARSSRLDSVVDEIRGRFGRSSVERATRKLGDGSQASS